jgi:peptidoglycan/xylan/chitin deacetylase (PgdA/CDA1 family)
MILMYHNVVPNDAIYGHNQQSITIRSSEFERHIALLNKVFTIIPLVEYVSVLEAQGSSPRNTLAITFDDGTYQTFESIIPVAKKFEVNFTIFASTCQLNNGDIIWAGYINALALDSDYDTIEFDDSVYMLNNQKARKLCKDSLVKSAVLSGNPVHFVDILRNKYPLDKEIYEYYKGLSSEQVLYGSKTGLIDIQSHSHFHNSMSSIAYDKKEYEIKKSKQILDSITNSNVKYFAYPSGDYDSDTIELLKENNYKAAFAVKPRNISKFSMYEIPRVGIFHGGLLKLIIKILINRLRS